uniref:ParB/RepB/Spo0J family partition protein n=1 Tax=Escherichia coli TaxID=562 RepID=UPI003F7E3E99
LEEAAAYNQMLSDFGFTHDELAERLRKSRPVITNTLRLLNLPPTVQKRLAAGTISAGHARALLGLNSADEMERLANKIVSEGLSVRAIE